MPAVREELGRVAASPEVFLDDPGYGRLAQLLCEQAARGGAFVPRESDAPYRIWGDNLDATALQQMKNACKLPVAVSGALMPDAHVGYGLPIGGVLATHDAVIPYAVGVDIACRMKLTVLDLPVATLIRRSGTADARAIERETRFGMGAIVQAPRQHDVMDRGLDASRPSPPRLKDRAWSQLGTSGSGNHFVEFGELTVFDDDVLGLSPGTYLALLSHSGQPRHRRADRAALQPARARRASRAAQELSHLAWLDLSSEAGQEYWAAMELMGQYAAANHALIHAHIARALGVEVLLDIENHHNFAWRERHRLPDGSEAEVIVHRKGATPAGAGVLGIIPGSMGTPGYVVRGKGVAASLNSAAHGAGRRMSRTQAKEHVHVGRRAAVSARARRHADVGRARRSADGLQGHRRGDGGAEAISSSRWRGSSRASSRWRPSGEPPED